MKRLGLIIMILIALALGSYFWLKSPGAGANTYLEGEEISKKINVTQYGSELLNKCFDSNTFTKTEFVTPLYFLKPIADGLKFSKPFVIDAGGQLMDVVPRASCYTQLDTEVSWTNTNWRLYDDILVIRTEFSRRNPTLDNSLTAIIISDTPRIVPAFSKTSTVVEYLLDQQNHRLYTSDYYALHIYDTTSLKVAEFPLLGSYFPNFNYTGSIDKITLNADQTVTLDATGFGLVRIKLDTRDPRNIKFISSSREDGKSFHFVSGSLRADHGSNYRLVHYVERDGISLVDIGSSKEDITDDKIIIADIEASLTSPLKEVISKNVAGAPTRIRAFSFPKDSTHLIFYVEPAAPKSPAANPGSGIFFKIDVAQTNPQFEFANLNTTTTPAFEVPKSEDDRYMINIGKNTTNTLGEGGEQELWLHDLVNDTSKRILTLTGNETLVSGMEINGRGPDCYATTFWPTWINSRVMQFSVYEYGGNQQCDVHYKVLRTMQYNIDTDKFTEVPTPKEILR